MTFKLLTFIALTFIFSTGDALSQVTRQATEKGANIFTGRINLSSRGGDLYDRGGRLNQYEIMPHIGRFLADGLSLGADLTLGYIARGELSSTNLRLGPSFGYYHESEGGNIPFFRASAALVHVDNNSSTNTGADFAVGPGFIVRKGHLGVVIEAGLIVTRIKVGEDTSASVGNEFIVSVGLAGLFY